MTVLHSSKGNFVVVSRCKDYMKIENSGGVGTSEESNARVK